MQPFCSAPRNGIEDENSFSFLSRRVFGGYHQLLRDTVSPGAAMYQRHEIARWLSGWITKRDWSVQTPRPAPSAPGRNSDKRLMFTRESVERDRHWRCDWRPV